MAAGYPRRDDELADVTCAEHDPTTRRSLLTTTPLHLPQASRDSDVSLAVLAHTTRHQLHKTGKRHLDKHNQSRQSHIKEAWSSRATWRAFTPLDRKAKHHQESIARVETNNLASSIWKCQQDS